MTINNLSQNNYLSKREVYINSIVGQILKTKMSQNNYLSKREVYLAVVAGAAYAGYWVSK